MISAARRFAKLAVTLAATALLASGCGEKIESVCEEKCGADAQSCIEKGEVAEATAEERGCESEFETYVACAGAKGVCTKGNLIATEPCKAEIKALDSCVK